MQFAIDLSWIEFPLIPLPIKEAMFELILASILKLYVSINSTSYKRSDYKLKVVYHLIYLRFPLIPLPIKEAMTL